MIDLQNQFLCKVPWEKTIICKQRNAQTETPVISLLLSKQVKHADEQRRTRAQKGEYFALRRFTQVWISVFRCASRSRSSYPSDNCSIRPYHFWHCRMGTLCVSLRINSLERFLLLFQFETVIKTAQQDPVPVPWLSKTKNYLKLAVDLTRIRSVYDVQKHIPWVKSAFFGVFKQ